MNADVIVIGLGGVGSAALFHLAGRGVRVLGIDRFAPGHDRGSSHGHSRIIRLAYFEHPDYVPLLRRAYELWADLERLQGSQLLLPTGLLEAGAPNGPTIQGILASARQHRLAIEELSTEECRQRFPGFVLPENTAAVFEPTAGVLRVEACVHAHFEQALRRGAQAAIGEAALGWTATADGIEVTTDRNVYRAARLIIAAGPWAARLLGPLGVPLTVRRKHLHWYPSKMVSYRAEEGCPTLFFETKHGEFYGIPAFDGRSLKVGEHSGGTTVADPLDDDRGVEKADRERIEAFLSECLPDVGRPALEHATCYYTMSPDGHFLVDRHPAYPHVAFAAGLSGHGFKFVGVLGEILADLALEGQTPLPTAFLGLRRFPTQCGGH
jgi:sarcosine oxidase